ncbi:peptidase domain-containing ABC transporter [Duganella sp. S19_KUP01_CR8]|uniref:peptidase domain-containing ABC transporter n=1 Tax=Duganella sp. S19_KUP01_CR8 TaxID=3025502 RepID=UPI002FCD741A
MEHLPVQQHGFFWALQTLCAVHRTPFSLALAKQQTAAPYTLRSFNLTGEGYGFDTALRKARGKNLHKESFPLVAWGLVECGADDVGGATNQGGDTIGDLVPMLVLQATGDQVLFVSAEQPKPQTMPLEHFEHIYQGMITRVRPKAEAVNDPDLGMRAQQPRTFGFAWFVPELLKYKRLWQEILLASLVIQLIALATPLFTQTIIDKVVVHHTQSTLIVIAIGMGVFMLFSAGLSWLRQYLVLHTGNRVDAVLGASVFEHLFKLPPLYFQHRPTGVIAARLHGIETIREFISSAAVTLVLDLPFLVIFAAIMFYYSVTLTLVVLAILAGIITMSLIIAPMFQTRLQQQFQLGARNQAFLTEYIVGLETVKSLQLEPQLNSKYSGYLATYLAAGFATKQLANTYNTVANLMEQLMSLLVLGIGAYTVMHSTEFTIGMLVAFQMFSGKLSQPMLRLVGLWQQFQQASLSMARLGDLMNAPIEPYSAVPARATQRRGEIAIEQVAFKYAEHLPAVYENLSLSVKPGQAIAIMGPSGCGKSTLAKLLQGFYQPSAGRITIDGVDIRYLSANELRSYFGVVPQETTLFSGTIYDNLQMASPAASFEQIVAACRMAEIHSVIEALPQGYQTEIGERGAGLSGGQKQRIAIARALLKRPNILVFDEATSALDGPTAEQFARTINGLRGKVTMLFITHGLPKGLKVDAVFRLGAQGAQQLASAVPAAAQGGGEAAAG